jgi:Xaa-Pro aminopeptidase
MTRTFVVGDAPDEIREWHRLCVEALERAVERARPGEVGRDLYAGVCEVFEGHGQRTLRTKPAGETLQEGFFHTLGHGVGLEVHEAPSLGLMGSAPLVAGDVLALEPGLYRPGLGGVRVEDLVLVGEDGPEVLTSFSRGLEP